jgi:hypothetical protein
MKLRTLHLSAPVSSHARSEQPQGDIIEMLCCVELFGSTNDDFGDTFNVPGEIDIVPF